MSEDIRALPKIVASGDAIVYLPSYNFKIGSYYGLPPSPPLPPAGGTPTPEELDGRRVWLVSGTLPAERYVHEARELLRGFRRWDVRHVPREKNRDADRLANEGVDRWLATEGATYRPPQPSPRLWDR